MFKRLILFATLCFCCAAFCGTAPKKKVLIVMLDGLRADAVENFNLPTLLKLRNGTWKPGYKGAWTDCARTISDAPAQSAPNHAAIATGVTAAKHHVTSNRNVADGNWKEWPSWLHRLVKLQPDKKVFFFYGWKESGKIDPTPLVPHGFGNDWLTSTHYPKIITEESCPAALMYYINAPDGGGHESGFYPYGSNYAATAYAGDKYLAMMLDLISRRPSFSGEDWLILVTADHGGYGLVHGQPGGHSDTVPLIVAGKNISPGRISGTPCVTDLSVTALEFLGVDTSKMNLDGKVITDRRTVEKKRGLSDALAVRLDFSPRPLPRNRASLSLSCAQTGTGVQSGHRLNKLFGPVLNCADIKSDGKFSPQGMTLGGMEKLAPEDGKFFTLTFWLRLPEKQSGDAVIIGNKSQSEKDKTGFFISAARKTVGSVKMPGVVLNFKDSEGTKSFDMGTSDIEPGQWTFYAVSVTPDGALYFFQGRNDGFLYHFVEKCTGTILNGVPWYISQPAAGGNSANLTADMDDLAVWNRPLSVAELRSICEAGRRGRSLEDLMQTK